MHDSVTPRGDLRGLAFDRDVVAYYGDPKWSAKLAPGKLAYGQKLTRKGNTYTLTITPKQGEESFETVNNNGSQRGGRPIVAFLPNRVQAVQLLEGSDLSPVIADDFILVPRPKQYDGKQHLQVKFKAKEVR